MALVDSGVSTTTVYLALTGISIECLLLILFILDYLRTSCQRRRRARSLQSLRLWSVLCIAFQIAALCDALFASSLDAFGFAYLCAVPAVLEPLLLCAVVLGVFRRFSALKHRRLRVGAVVGVAVYVALCWTASLALRFASHFVPRWASESAWMALSIAQCAAASALAAFWCKLRRAQRRAFEFQSMFVVDKSAVHCERRAIERRLRRWQRFVLGALCSVLARAAFALASFGAATQKKNLELALDLVGDIALDATAYALVVSEAMRGAAQFASMAEPRFRNGDGDGDAEDNVEEDLYGDDDSEMSLTASTTMGTLTNTELRINAAFTQIIYMDDQ